MFLLFLLINIPDCSSFDFPLGRPQVAFQPKKLNKYYDLAQQAWKDSEQAYKGTYNQILSFCQDTYPDLIVTYVQQGSTEVLTFCNMKNHSKCSEKRIITWLCSTHKTNPSVSPSSTAMYHYTPEQCFNETIHPLRYTTCVSVVVVAQLNHCLEYNLTMNKMNQVRSCNATDGEGNIVDGLDFADLQCCSKSNHNANNDMVTIGPGPMFPPIEHTKSTFQLPEEWCNLTGVEDRRVEMTKANLLKMKEIYNSTSEDVKLEDIVFEIKEVEGEMNKEVVRMYSEHFICLVDTIKHSMRFCDDFFIKLEERQQISISPSISIVQSVNKSVSLVENDFRLLCERSITGETLNGFTAEYRSLVQRLQALKKEIDRLELQIRELGDNNCVECTTPGHTSTHNNPIIPHNGDPGDRDYQDELDDEQQKLTNQKYLIAIVSTVSCIIILVALVFFVVVVRRTLRNDIRRKYTSYPPNEMLSPEQYVVFLQKNGYANPTCRLPQKYLDDHD